MREAGGVDRFGHRLALGLDFVQPFLVDVLLPGPDVGEPGGGLAVLRPFDTRRLGCGRAVDSPVGQGALLQGHFFGAEGGFQVAGESVVFGEGRVGDDQIHRFVVQRPQQFQVVGDHHVPIKRMRGILLRGHGLLLGAPRAAFPFAKFNLDRGCDILTERGAPDDGSGQVQTGR